ncbi:MAG TPA: glycosyltransferase family 2 protein [Candidatus Saccharimonadia bacterium]|nr:glycosyltransferase family 2 protein [Candidatus Saccharimonadia bacterium]
MSDPPAKQPSVVSIGIPVFNGEKHIAQALDSALAQDYPNLEIIVSDNASTDGTRRICKDYARRDSRIRYHRNSENLGVGRNFEKVLQRATGEYFTWLASDDVLSCTNYISELAGYLDQNRDVVLCGCSMKVFVDEDPLDIRAFVLTRVFPEQEWKEARKEFFRWPQTDHHFVIYGLYRREALLKVPINGRNHLGRPVVLDMEFPILSILCNHGRIVALPEVLRGYRSQAYSSCTRDIEELPAATQFWLALRTKFSLLRTAAALKVPLNEKWELLKLTLGNFTHHHLGRLPEFRANLRALRLEVGVLRKVCDERLDLINRQDSLLQSMETRIKELEKQSRAALREEGIGL